MKTKKPLLSRELREIRQVLLEKTGYRLKDYLIEQAFTRSSYSRRYGGDSNENLEFIGDTILAYHVVRHLVKHYGAVHSDNEGSYYLFRAHEKDLASLKSAIVSNRTLAEIIDTWDLCRFLIVGKSDIDNQVDKQEKIKADLLEAIIGAYAVQVNWDQEVMDSIVSRILPIEQFILDYEKTQYRPIQFQADNAVSTLKELAEHEKCPFPEYEITGPDRLGFSKSGRPKWNCICSLQDKAIVKTVFAYSKKDAKKYAAYLVLCEMFELPNEFGPSKSLSVWNYDGEKLRPGSLEED